MAGIFLILLWFKVGLGIALFFAIFLICKGLLFLGDISSVIDIVSGVIFIFAALGIYNLFTWLAVIWLLQKGAFSLIGSV